MNQLYQLYTGYSELHNIKQIQMLQHFLEEEHLFFQVSHSKVKLLLKGETS